MNTRNECIKMNEMYEVRKVWRNAKCKCIRYLLSSGYFWKSCLKIYITLHKTNVRNSTKRMNMKNECIASVLVTSEQPWRRRSPCTKRNELWNGTWNGHTATYTRYLAALEAQMSNSGPCVETYWTWYQTSTTVNEGNLWTRTISEGRAADIRSVESDRLRSACRGTPRKRIRTRFKVLAGFI